MQIGMNSIETVARIIDTRCKAKVQNSMVLSSAQNQVAKEFGDLGSNMRGEGKDYRGWGQVGETNKSQDWDERRHSNDHTETVTINVKNPKTTEEEG